MKLPVLITSFYVIYLSSIHVVSRAQDFEDPTRFFTPFEFERTVRGGFNFSTCLQELLTCLENVRGDIICSNKVQFETVCSIMNEQCDEDRGYMDRDWQNDALFENVCKDWWFQKYT